jgi:hypothetical protein
MNTVLIILAILGVGAILISAYVFAIAARRYVSEAEDEAAHMEPAPPQTERLRVVRSGADRRQSSEPASFPLIVDGIVVQQERRHIPDRRAAG